MTGIAPPLTLGAALALVSGAASACVLDTPVCEVAPGRFARLVHPDLIKQGATVFTEYEIEGDDRERLYLVECRSRAGVVATLDGADPDTEHKAQDYLVDAVLATRSVGLGEIDRNLTRLGFETERLTLPLGHCGCDLTGMKMTLSCGPGQ